MFSSELDSAVSLRPVRDALLCLYCEVTEHRHDTDYVRRATGSIEWESSRSSAAPPPRSAASTTPTARIRRRRVGEAEQKREQKREEQHKSRRPANGAKRELAARGLVRKRLD